MNSVYETVYSSRSTYIEYMNEMTEIWEKDSKRGSYMKYMIHTLASGFLRRNGASQRSWVRIFQTGCLECRAVHECT